MGYPFFVPLDVTYLPAKESDGEQYIDRRSVRLRVDRVPRACIWSRWFSGGRMRAGDD
jgi:hypothetical protein